MGLLMDLVPAAGSERLVGIELGELPKHGNFKHPRKAQDRSEQRPRVARSAWIGQARLRVVLTRQVLDRAQAALSATPAGCAPAPAAKCSVVIRTDAWDAQACSPGDQGGEGPEADVPPDHALGSSVASRLGPAVQALAGHEPESTRSGTTTRRNAGPEADIEHWRRSAPGAASLGRNSCGR